MTDTVLIVDDSLTVRMDLSEAFEAAGFTALGCGTIGEAQQLLAGRAVNVVVLDVILPDGDGVDLLKELRAAPATVTMPVLMLSSEAEVKDRIRGLQTGADEYVGKPYDAGYVVGRARELVRGAHAGASEAGAATVLLIDDSETFRNALGDAFRRAGYSVLTAASGEEGLRIAADRRPQAIVVDGVLPGIDGPTVIRHVRLDAALRSVPCLLLTGAEEREAELRALDAGADAFVRKDDDVEVIMARFASSLRRIAKAPAEEVASLASPKKILAVDDSYTYLQEVGATLRDEGFDVVLARSGEEAIELLAVQPVDCILLDLIMPGLSGKETCQRIKAAPGVRDIPLIMLTALEDREAMLEGLGAGADDYIQKSSEFEVLKARVRAQIRRKQFEDENRLIREELLRKEFEAAEARAAKELHETRAALVDELSRKNKELEAFSYSVSHDLRAPLRTIDGFSYALLKGYSDKLDERGQNYLHRVRAAAHRMAELIDDLLELARVSRTELQRDQVDLSALVRHITNQLQTDEPDRRVDVVVQDSVVVQGDSQLLRIVLENLLSNAWKFTRHTSDPRIEFGTTYSSDGPVHFIRDNGAGFDMTYVDKLFGVFQRLHSQQQFPGTGIGLATVQRIVLRHGGRVWAEGRVEAGATFYFTL